MLCCAIDPGRSGGALLALDGRAIAAACWRPHQRQGRTVYSLAYVRHTGDVHTQRGLPGAWALGTALRQQLGPVLALHGGGMLLASEAAHAGRNIQTGLRLARWGGALAAPLEQYAPHGAATWAEPSEWRKVIFRPRWWATQAAEAGAVISAKAAAAQGLPRMTKREAAKREAALVVPPQVPGLLALIDRLPAAGAEHVLDAAGVCRWRWLLDT